MGDTRQVKSIEEAFPEGKFWAFRAFCKRKGIINVSDLRKEHIEEHSRRRNVDPHTITFINQRLNKMLNNKTEKIVILEDFEQENPINYSNLPEISIEKLFCGKLF